MSSTAAQQRPARVAHAAQQQLAREASRACGAFGGNQNRSRATRRLGLFATHDSNNIDDVDNASDGSDEESEENEKDYIDASDVDGENLYDFADNK